MKLKRTHSQEQETLEDYYLSIGKDVDPFAEECSRMMVAFIRYLERHNIGADKGISTALQQLVFRPAPDISGPSVIVSAWAGVYKIQYALPAEEAPWPYAYVAGETRDVAKAAQMLLSAFERAFDRGAHGPDAGV